MCHVIRRTCVGLEVDPFELGGEADLSESNVAKSGHTSVTVMIDAERWLQVGSKLERTGSDGKPILIQVRMDGESILYRTLWLFFSAFAAAVLLLGVIVWLTVRKGVKQRPAA